MYYIVNLKLIIMKKIAVLTLLVIFIVQVQAQNTAYGTGALASITTGTFNSAFGTNALFGNTSGYDNIAVGEFALIANTNGYSNIGIGSQALINNSTGYDNIGIGSYAISTNTTGTYNIGVGNNVMGNNTTGNYNMAVGHQALYNNSTGSSNLAVGMRAGNSLQTGNNNTIIGHDWAGLLGITTGSNNTIIGSNVSGLASNLSNTIILADGSGNQRLYIDNNGNAGFGTTSPNTRLEVNSNVSATSGLRLTQLSSISLTPVNNGKTLSVDAVGNVILTTAPGGGGGSGWSLTGNAGTVDGTNFIGTTDNVPFNIRVNNQMAGRLDPALYNTFYGVTAGSNNSTGNYNTVIGHEAFLTSTSGYGNTSVGFRSLQFNTTGNTNTAAGHETMQHNTTGHTNAAFGIQSLQYNTTGYANSGFGASALFTTTTGTYNSSVGYASLAYNTTGSFNSSLGFGTDVPIFSTFSNATALGALAIVNAGDKVRIGDVNVTVIEGQPAFYTGSDGRFKTNISEDDVKGLDFIKRLRPVVYNFDTRKFEEFLTDRMPDSARAIRLNRDFSASTRLRRSGFIAQEVELAANEAGYNFDAIHKPANATDNYSLAYGQFVVPLVKAVQELSDQNELLKKEIAGIRALLNNQEGTINITDAGSKLFQNTPNPFSKSTVIRYTIPSTAKNAIITIVSTNGVKIKEFDLKTKAGQNIEIAGGQLAAGIYIYSLLVDGKLIDSKQMILTN